MCFASFKHYLRKRGNGLFQSEDTSVTALLNMLAGSPGQDRVRSQDDELGRVLLLRSGEEECLVEEVEICTYALTDLGRLCLTAGQCVTSSERVLQLKAS